MIRNYFKTTLRSLWKNKGFSLLNIFGLSIGIAAALLLTLFVRYELSYDNFYQDGDRVYRVYNEYKYNSREGTSITGSGLLAPTLEQEIPEIEVAGRSHMAGTQLLKFGEKGIYEPRLRFADPGMMDILEVDFISGDPSVLETPNSLVLTESLAAKLFEKPKDCLGKNIYIGESLTVIKGLIKDLPKNSHFIATGFISTPTLGAFKWDRMGHVTYVKLKEGTQKDEVVGKLPQLVDRFITPTFPTQGDYQTKLGLYPMKDIYLSEDPGQEAAGNRKAVVIFSIIAVFLILIASINYMNLATARAMKRMKEVGMRKVIGAARKQLIFQFLMESWMIALLSVLLGGFIAEMASGIFNDLTGKTIEIGLLSNFSILGGLLVTGVIIGFLAGIYPAFILSSFKAIDICKGGKAASRSNKSFRRVLVSFQFIISIGLMISTLVVYKQLNFMENKDLGYNKQNILSIRLREADYSEVMKLKLAQIPSIEAVSATNLLPPASDFGATFEIKNEQGEVSKDIVSMASVDSDYLPTMQMRLVAGRNFSKEFETDKNAIIINETFAKKYGWIEPIGKTIEINEESEQAKYHIIGVVEDFNMLSLYQEVKPFALFSKPEFDWGGQYLLARISPNDVEGTMAAIKTVYESVEKDYPLNTNFISESLQRTYSEENKRAEIYLSFSVITILIACVGLFGLAAFTLEQKMKEISIRKVLGAKLNDIIGLVSKEFIIIIVVSALIASPLAYYFMQGWLESFAYRTDFSAGLFILACLATLSIALFTIGFQSLRTARTNPADILKND